MYRIMHVKPTDYEMSPDREKLQQLADELNMDARRNGDKESRWIVVPQEAVGDLFDAAQRDRGHADGPKSTRR